MDYSARRDDRPPFAGVFGETLGIGLCGASQYGQPWIQSYTPAGSAADYVLRDQQGDPLGYVKGGASYAYATDDIGSVTSIIDSAGTVQGAYTYDPYGHGSTATGTAAASNLIRYTGALQDTNSNYTHLGNRWYNPVTADFTTQDTSSYLASPSNGNRYAYAADNPVNYTDPTGNGTTPADVCGLAGGLVTFAAASVLTVALVIAAPPAGVALAASLIGGGAISVIGAGIGYACSHSFS